MTEMHIGAALQQLENTLTELKSLLAWEELKQAEARPGERPGFTLGDTVEEDIKNAYSCFLAHDLELKHTLCHLHGTSLTQGRKEALRRKMADLERRFRQLHLAQRFIKF